MKIDDKTKAIASEVGRLFHEAGIEIFLVGGAVRDMVAGELPHDLDFVTGATQKQIMKVMRPAYTASYDKSRAKGYGTTGVVLKSGEEIEITPFRIAEGVEKSENPLHDDLWSRDFTVNAIALDISPENFMCVVDPCGGVEDFHNRILATPASPMITFKDDPLRILRAARFSAAFGLKPRRDLVDGVKLVAADSALTGRVALERVREELFKILMDKTPSSGLYLMIKWGLMNLWLPEVTALSEMVPGNGLHHKNVFEHTMKVVDRAVAEGPQDAVFRFAALLHDIGKPETRTLVDGEYSFNGHEIRGAEMAVEICERFKCSNEQIERIAELVEKHHRIHGYTSEWTDSAVRRALNALGESYAEIIALARMDITSSIEEKVSERLAMVDEFVKRVSNIELKHVLNPKPPVSGKDVMKLLGINPGPEVGKVIQFLKDKIVSGDLAPDDENAAKEIVLSREWM